MLNFDFLENDQGIVSPPHFMYDFLRKFFLMYILLTEITYCLIAFTFRDIGQ